MRCCSDLPRGRGPGHHERARERHGFGSVQQSGWTPVGGCGRWADPWHGAQFAIDTTLISPLHRDGSARARAPDHNGAALMHDGGKSPIPNCQVMEGGRAWWSSQPKLEADGTKRRPPACQLWPRLKPLSRLLQGRVEAAYIHRWSAVLACSAARAFSLSLLDRRPVHGTGAECMRCCGMPVFRRVLCKCFLLCNFLGLTFLSHIQDFAQKKSCEQCDSLLGVFNHEFSQR